MGTKTWSGRSGDWNVASFWNPGTVPGPGDTAILSGDSGYLVTIGTSAAAEEVQTVTAVTLQDAAATLQIAQGSTLATTGTFSLLAGSLSLLGVLDGGVILGNGGSLQIGGIGFQNSGTLSHATVAGTLQAGGEEGTLDITGGLAFQPVAGAPGVLALAGGSEDQIAFLDAETVNNGVISLQENGATLAATTGAVTFGSAFTLAVAAPNFFSASATLDGSFVNDGTISVGSLASLFVEPAELSGTGVIDLAADAALDVGSLSAAQLLSLASTVVSQGGSLVIDGTLDNRAGVLDFTTGTLAQELDLSAATVLGGAIELPTGSVFSGNFGTLSDVTVEGVFSPFEADAINGLTLTGAGGVGPGSLDLRGGDNLDYLDSETLQNADVTASEFGDAISGPASGALTLANDVTIDVAGGNQPGELTLSAGTLVNHAAIAVAGGASVAFSFTGNNFVNDGSVSIAAGGLVSIGGTVTVTQLLADLDTVQNNGGTVELTGTILNSGTLDLPGNVVLDADIIGGTVINEGSLVIGEAATLNGVTFVGPVNFATNPGGELTLVNGLTLDSTPGVAGGAIDMGGFDLLILSDTETFTTGTLNLAGDSTVVDDGESLTVGAGFTIDASGQASIETASLVNAGQIIVAPGTASLDLETSTVDNSGVIGVGPGGELGLGDGQTLSLTGAGAIALSAGSTLALDAAESTGQLLGLLGTAPDLSARLSGTLLNTAPLVVDTSVPLTSLVLSALVVGGTIVNGDGSLTVTGGTLDNVTFEGPLDTGTGFAEIAIAGGVTFENAAGGLGGTVNLAGDDQRLTLLDNETLDNATINLTGELEEILADTGTLDLGAHLAIAVDGSAGIFGPPSSTLSANTLVNAGSITVATGNTLDLGAATIFNSGDISVAAGGELAIGIGTANQTLSVANTGIITLTPGATLALGGTVTTREAEALLGAGGGVTLALDGTLLNAGTSLVTGVDPLAAVVLGSGGDVVKGVLVSGSGLSLQGGTLTGVTVVGPLTLTTAIDGFQTIGGELDISGGVTLDSAGGAPGGTIVLSGPDETLGILDSETLDNALISVLGTQDSIATTASLTLGAGVTLDAPGVATLSAATLVNKGHLIAAGSSGGVFLDSATISNTGVITAGFGNTIGIAVDASREALAGTLTLGSGFALTLAAVSTLEIGAIATTGELLGLVGAATGVAVQLLGTLRNTGSVLTSTAGGTLGNLFLDADIIGGVVAADTGTVLVGGGTFDNVTFEGPLDLGTQANLSFRDGFDIAAAGGGGLGTIDAEGASDTLTFLDSETLAGVIVNAPTTDFGIVNATTVAALAIGATATLAVGAQLDVAAASVVNAGTITATGADASVTFSSGTLINSGVIAIGAGETLALDTSSFGTGLGDTLDVVNTNVLTVAAGGTLILGSTETTAALEALLAGIAPAGVTVEILGTLLNGGAVLDIAATGSLSDVILDADVVGGVIENDGGSLAVTGGTFDNVVFQGPLDLTAGLAALSVENGLALQAGPGGGAGTINVTGDNDAIDVIDNTALGDVTVNVAPDANIFSIESDAPTLTLSNGVTFNASSEVVLGAPDAIVSAADVEAIPGALFSTGAVDYAADTIVNSGTVIIATGAALGIDPGGPVQAGATLDLVNTGQIALAPGSTLAVGGAQSTAQLVTLLDGLAGSLGQNGVFLTLGGSIDNAGTALVLAPGEFGQTSLAGTIAGGTVINDGGLVDLGNAAFQTVTVEGPLAIGNGNAYLTVTGGLTLLNTLGNLPGSLALAGSGDTVDFAGNQSIDNAGILVSGSAVRIEHGALTLGQGISLSVTGQLTDGVAFGTGTALINDGTVADNGILLLDDQTVINNGLLTVGAYDLLGVALAGSSGASLPFTNTGVVTFAAGSTFLVGGTETDAQLDLLLGSLSNPGVVVALDGTLLNDGVVFSTTAGGLLNDVMLDATVVGGTITDGTGALAVRGGEFDGVTYQGTLALVYGPLQIANGITLANGTGPGAIAVSTGAGLDFTDSADVLANAAVAFDGVFEQLKFQTLTLAASLSVTVDGSVLMSGHSLVADTDITELGAFSTIEINGDFTNDAVVTIGAEDVLDLENFNAAGPIAVGGTGSFSFAPGSTLELGGQATPSQIAAEIGNLVGAQPGVAIQLDGTILNTAASLVIGAGGPLSDLTLDAVVVGGTIDDTAGGSLTILGGGFSGLVFEGPALVLGGFEGGLDIIDGLTILASGGGPGTLEMTGTSEQLLLLASTPTLDNLTLQVSGLNDQIVQGTAGSLTLGANFFGTITGYGLVQADTIATAATIDIAAGAVFQLAANTIFNSGTIYVGGQPPDGTQSNGSSNNGVDKTVFGTAIGLAVLGIGNDDEDPFGSYSAAQKFLDFLFGDPNNVVFGTDSGLAIGSILQTGQLPALFADFDTQPDLVILDGSIDNSNATLEVTPAGTLSNVLVEALISGGTIVDDGQLSFALVSTLTGVTFVGGIDLSPNDRTTLVLSNSQVIGANGGPGTIGVNGSFDSLQFHGSLTTATIDNLLVNLAMVQGATADSLSLVGGTAELGSGVTIDVGGTASINVLTGDGFYSVAGNAVVTNNGVIIDDGALSVGENFLAGATFVNAGLISVGAATIPPVGLIPALDISGSFVNTGTIAVAGPENALVETASFANSGEIDLSGGATLTIATAPADAGVVTMEDGTETLRYTDTLALTATIDDFNVSDVVDLTTVAFAGASLGTLVNGVLDVFEGTTLAAALSFPSFPYTQASFAIQQDAGTGSELVTNQPPCFLAGTRIRTIDGEVAVEHLAVGMQVVTLAGGSRPVRWIGHRRVDCRRHPRPDRVQPIRVCAGAFGDGVPTHDLRLSPDHSLFVDGVLIPVQHLLNGATVRREQVVTADYFHIELSAHDVLFAEGLPAESYLDTGNRAAFANGRRQTELHPDFFPKTWDDACAPLCQGGAIVAAVRTRLLKRAYAAGYRIGPCAVPTLLVGGRQIRAVTIAQHLHRFLLPSGTSLISIVSASGVPSAVQAGSTDNRQLGVAIGGIVADGRPIDLADRALVSGFYDIEHRDGVSLRWTLGHAELDLPPRRTPTVLELRVVEGMTAWQQPAGLRRTLPARS